MRTVDVVHTKTISLEKRREHPILVFAVSLSLRTVTMTSNSPTIVENGQRTVVHYAFTSGVDDDAVCPAASRDWQKNSWPWHNVRFRVRYWPADFDDTISVVSLLLLLLLLLSPSSSFYGSVLDTLDVTSPVLVRILRSSLFFVTFISCFRVRITHYPNLLE